jgi:hypothetical protein
MNAERLHVIALVVLDDLKQTNAEALLGAIVQSLQNQINQPQQPQYQQQVVDNLRALEQALSNAPSNAFSPAWKSIIKEIAGEALLGEELKVKIQEIFQRNQITPSIALEEIRSLHTALSKFRSALEQVVTGFGYLNIGKEELKPGECEVGILIPRSLVQSKLKDFGQELSELDKVLGVFSELVTGSRPGYEIRSISSSDFWVGLGIAVGVLSCITQVLDNLTSVYERIAKWKIARTELLNDGVPPDTLKGLEDYATTIIVDVIKEIAQSLLDKYWKDKDEGRRNELAVELEFSLKKIAERIDRGVNFEIRVGPIEKQAEGETEEMRQLLQDLQYIRSVAQRLPFLKLQGEPILSLPDPETEKEQKNGNS